MNVNVSYVTQYGLSFQHVIHIKNLNINTLKLLYVLFFPTWSLKPGIYSTLLQHVSVWTTHIQVLRSHMWGCCLLCWTWQVHRKGLSKNTCVLSGL